MAKGGFEVNTNNKKPRGGDRPQTARGGGDRGGRGRGGPPRRDGDRPNTGRPERPPRNKEDGGERGGNRGRGGDRKPREGRGGAEGDRKPRGDRPPRKEREDKPKVAEEEKKEEAPKQEMIEEVLGQSLDDFFKKRTGPKIAKEGRQAEGVKGQKVAAHESEKVKQSTVVKSLHGQETIATTTAETNKLFGFRGGDDAEFAGRGRGGQGRGGAPKTGGRKGPKQALKKTEMDFPTL